MIAALLLLIVTLGGLASAFAAGGHGGFAVDAWTTDEGLPQNSVIAMAQTGDGYLWLGTLNGLARFDGVRFRVFDENNTPELGSSKIIRLFKDSRENLWIGTEPGGILVLSKDGKFATATFDGGRETAGGRLMSITEDASGAVWLYTADGRLGRFREGQMSVWVAGGRFSSRTRAVVADTSGFVWVGTERTLTGLGPMPVAGVALPAPVNLEVPGRLEYLLPSRNGGYWRIMNGRIQRCIANDVQVDLGRYPWPTNVMATAACEDLSGHLIIGTYGEPGAGVFWFGPAGQVEEIKGLSHPSILSLLMDREGSLWVGTDGGGLNRVRRQKFGVVESSKDSTVQSLSANPGGGIWIGYNGERVELWTEEQVKSFAVKQPQQALAVRSVFVDAGQQVWVGTVGGGLFQLQGTVFEPVTAFGEVANPNVSAICQDRGGRLWVGTQGGAVYHEGNHWRTFGVLDGLSAGAVTAMAEDATGSMWVGTDGGGLNRIRNGAVTQFGRTNGLPSERVSSLLVDSDGVVWVGTSGGLGRYDGKQWTAYTTREGLAANNIGYLVEDRQGGLWLGSRSGLMRAPKEALNDFARGRTNSIRMRAYGKADGLPTRECSQGSQPAACQTADGRMWFSTIKGVAWIDPARLAVNSNAPPVVIEAVLIDGEEQSTNSMRVLPLEKVTLPAAKKTLEIHFASLSLGAPAEGRHRYRLEGHETAWTEAQGTRGRAHYTRLPHGTYEFHVQACNEDQVWNLAGARLTVTILPPFWRTWWFVTLSSLVLLGTVVGSVYYVSTQKLQRQVAALRQQEALERERARIARDLHDQLGANLTQVALLGELVETDKELPGEVEEHGRQISHTARETTHALDEIVWTVNPANDTLDELLNYLCKYSEEYLTLAGLRFRVEVPAKVPPIPISPELRHNAFLAAKEAVNNIVKHSQASAAWLRLQLEPGRFTLELEDNGRGLNQADYAKGRNGLKNMQRRMEDVGGSFSAQPGRDGGTLIRLSAPVKDFPDAKPGQSQEAR